MNEEDVINKKESKFQKIKKLFVQNVFVRLGIYTLGMIIVVTTSIHPIFSIILYGVFTIVEANSKYMSSDIGVSDLSNKNVYGSVDQKVIDFFKKVFKKHKKKKITSFDGASFVSKTRSLEKINDRLKELNPEGSIVRDPKEIAKEKAEYEGLLELLDKYQAMPKKDQTVNYTPVPTIEVDSTSDKGYSYTKK